MSLPLPSSPHGLSCLHAVPTLTLTHLLCHGVCGTVASPSSPVAQPTQGWSTPSCPQWTFFLCGLLSPFTPHWPVDSFILWNNSPPPPPGPWIQWTHPFVGWRTHAVAGSRCLEHSSQAPPGNTSQHLHAPSHGASCQWRLDSSHSEVSFLPMPRTEHTPGCQFGLHISAFLSLWCSSVALTLPIPLQPCRTSLTGHGEDADIRRCTHCSLGTWGKELNPGWRGWEGFLIYFSFF